MYGMKRRFNSVVLGLWLQTFSIPYVDEDVKKIKGKKKNSIGNIYAVPTDRFSNNVLYMTLKWTVHIGNTVDL